MERKRYEFVLEATQPIAHHSESLGNEAFIARRKVRQNGGWANIPIVTADTMRHGMREAASYALLDAAGMLGDKLNEAALRLLFAGGMVTGKGDASSVKLDHYRELVELVPPLALFGGCAQNRVIPGRLNVLDATLICEETRRFVPEWAVGWAEEMTGALEGARAHVEVEQRVRMDPSLSPEKRLLLTTGERSRVEGRLIASEASGDDAVTKERTKSTMMPRSFERVAQGSLFWWQIEARCYSELDVDTFHVCAAAFLAQARVGGKKATGHGLLSPVAGRNVRLNRPSEDTDTLDVGALGPRVGQVFSEHVKSRSERLKKLLEEVDA